MRRPDCGGGPPRRQRSPRPYANRRWGEREGAPDWSAGCFLATDERERLLVALAELVAERGYERTTVTAIADRVGEDVEAYNRHFSSLEEGFLAAYDAVADRAFSAAADAFVATPGSWAEATHAALGGLLGYIGGTPAFAYLMTVELAHVGKRALPHRRRTLDLFAELLGPGYAGPGAPPLPREVVADLLGGGLFEVLRVHVESGRLSELPDALPGVTLVALAPFVGRDEALRIAALPLEHGAL